MSIKPIPSRLLQPRRMPTKRAIAQAPSLAMVEHNALYHLLSRSNGNWILILPFLVAWLNLYIGFAAIFLIGGRTDQSLLSILLLQLLVTVFLVALAGGSYLVTRLKSSNLNLAAFFITQEEALGDLWVCPLSDEDLAIAIWGSRCHVNFLPMALFLSIPGAAFWIMEIFLNHPLIPRAGILLSALPIFLISLHGDEAMLGLLLAYVESSRLVRFVRKPQALLGSDRFTLISSLAGLLIWTSVMVGPSTYLQLLAIRPGPGSYYNAVLMLIVWVHFFAIARLVAWNVTRMRRDLVGALLSNCSRVLKGMRET